VAHLLHSRLEETVVELPRRRSRAWPVRDLEKRIRRLERTVAAVSARLESLERGVFRPPAPQGRAAAAGEAPALAGATQYLQGVPALAGRSCLVLGGRSSSAR